MAYARLGTIYGNLGQTTRSAENARKAYELRERVSEPEKFYIVSHYEHYATGNLEAARRTYELWTQTYPREVGPPVNLAVVYGALGDHDKALAAAQDGLKLDPGSGLGYTNLATAYLGVNRLDQARATAQEAQAHHLDNPGNHLLLYTIDFLQHDAAGMEREAAALMGKPDSKTLYSTLNPTPPPMPDSFPRHGNSAGAPLNRLNVKMKKKRRLATRRKPRCAMRW
jgi:tetratricopeptide (TPR) repeat protein